MTLIPEPREVRSLRRPGTRPHPHERHAQERLEETYTRGVRDAFEAATDTRTKVVLAYASLATVAWEFLFAVCSPKARRGIRKKLRLIAHYQSKLDRIPAWKR